MKIFDCLCGLFRPGSGRRRVHANHQAAAARVAELEAALAGHADCEEVLDSASDKYGQLLERYRAERERSMCFEQQLTDLRTELENTEQRHRREIDRVLNQRPPRTGCNEKTGPIDVRVLRASAAAERAILAVPTVERTLTMPPMPTEAPTERLSAITAVLPVWDRTITVAPIKPVELSPITAARAQENVLAAVGADQ